MKKNNLLIGVALSIVLFFSCEDLIDPSDSNEVAAKLEGTWSVDETLKSPTDVHQVYIELNEFDSSKVIISNFNGLGNSYEVMATVNGYSITIPNQNMIDGFSARGSGSISSNYEQIEWTYYVDDGSGEEVAYDAIYTFRY